MTEMPVHLFHRGSETVERSTGRQRCTEDMQCFGVRRSAAPDRALEFHAWAGTTKGQIVGGGAEIGTYAQFIACEVAIFDPADGPVQFV